MTNATSERETTGIGARIRALCPLRLAKRAPLSVLRFAKVDGTWLFARTADGRGRRTQSQVELRSGRRKTLDRGIAARGVPISNVRDALDRDDRFKHRRLDVQCGRGLAHDEPDEGCVPRFARSSSEQRTVVSSRAGRRRTYRHRRQASLADLGRECDRRAFRRLCRVRVVQLGYAGLAPVVHVPCQRLRSADLAGMAGGRSEPRAQRRTSRCHICEQRRLQLKSSGWTGASGSDHRSARNSRAVCHQRRQQLWRHRSIHRMARTESNGGYASSGALRQRSRSRPAIRDQQRGLAKDVRENGRVLSVCEFLLGIAPARRSPARERRPGDIRLLARRDRPRGGGCRIRDALLEEAIWCGWVGCGSEHRHGDRARAFRDRARANRRVDCEHRGGSGVDLRCGDAKRIGSACAAGLGTRSWACDVYDGHVRISDARQRAVGTTRNDHESSGRALYRGGRDACGNPRLRGAGNCKPANGSTSPRRRSGRRRSYRARSKERMDRCS